MRKSNKKIFYALSRLVYDIASLKEGYLIKIRPHQREQERNPVLLLNADLAYDYHRYFAK
jgi:hypothetical protein